MIPLRRIFGTAVVLTATSAVVGCSSADQTVPRPSVPTPSASTVVLMPPEVRPGHHQIASGGPRRGDWDLGPVQLTRGISWVNVNCVADTGTGQITLSVDTVGEFTIDCPSTEVRINVNQLDLAEGRKGRFHIETTDNVRWIANIQVPD